jgi:predicted nucleotidyltransferase
MDGLHLCLAKTLSALGPLPSALAGLFRPRSELILENLALRQQLTVLAGWSFGEAQPAWRRGASGGCGGRGDVIAGEVVPESGMIVPGMGTKRPEFVRGGVASALFTPVQQRVLGLLFGQPERRFQSAELIRLADSGTGAVHRQLQRLAAAGLVTVTRDGNQKYYQARQDSPIFPELHGLIVRTVGLVEPLRAALESVAERVDVAFVYGSVAKGSDRAGSDVDLLVVSDGVGYPEVYEVLQVAERALARPINPTVLTVDEWRKKRAGRDSFVRRIAAQPRLFVIGSDDALA